MRIFFVHQIFRSPSEGGCIRSFYVVRELLNRGHEIILIRSAETDQGITLKDLPEKYHNQLEVFCFRDEWSNNLGFLSRIRAFINFLWMARRIAKKRDFDLVYAISVPLTTGLLAIWTKKPFIFEVGDLWPDVPIEMGILKNRIIRWYLLKLEKKIYKKAGLIISLSKDIQSAIYKKWPFTANLVVENFSDPDLFYDEGGNRKYKSSEPIINKTAKTIICSYVGTAGKANDLKQMLELASKAEKIYPEMKFYFMISGMEEQFIRKSAPENVFFIDFGNKEKVAELLSFSDFNFVCYAQYDILGTGSPNKFFDGLAASCISIINVPGWINDLITERNAGLFWNTKDHDSLLREMKRIHTDSDLFQLMKANARELANSFHHKKMTAKICQQIELRF